METERSKFNKPAQGRGGKDSTKTVLTAAGVVAVGAAGAAVAATEWDNEVPADELPLEATPVEIAEEPAAEQTLQTAQTTQQSSPAQEIQPVDGGQTGSPATGQGQQTQEDPDKDDEPYSSIDDVDPDLIAQEITAVEIDPNDVDVADVLTIDNIDTFYFEDGSQMPVALVHTEDNAQYLMVDVDDDMTFDVICDLEGNPITQVEGSLTMSDVIDMFDETGGELAFNTEQIEQELAGTGDSAVDIIDTSGLAMVHAVPVTDEEFGEPSTEEETGGSETDDLAETETDEDDTIGELDA